MSVETHGRVKRALLIPMAAFYVIAGLNHFRDPAFYLQIMPPWLPWHLPLVWISGVAEVALGLAVLPRPTRRWAAWGIVALLVAVFPANLHMALNDVPIDGEHLPTWALWLRLPLQGLLIAWAFGYTRAEKASHP